MTVPQPYRRFPRLMSWLEDDDVKAKYGIDTVYRMHANETPLGPSPRAIAAMAATAADLGTYPPMGDENVRAKLAEIWGQGLAADNFYLGCSGYEALELVTRAYLTPGDNVIVCPPTFGIYYKCAALEGATVTDVPLKADFTVDVDAVLAAVTERTRLLILCNPNNPTGNIALDQAGMDRLVAEMPDHVIILSDEVYYHFVENENYPNSVAYALAGKPVILIHSFSKSYCLPGLRLGYAIAPVEIADYVAGVQRGFHLNKLALVGAMAALEDQEHMKRNVAAAKSGRKWIAKQLEELGLDFVPSETNYLMVKLPKDPAVVSAELERQGILVRPQAGGPLDGYLRVSSTVPAGNEAFVSALARILEDAS
ncbi:MAG: aminotransferase class I/II-fold pyridoxal phosphate-dependent enzyme [Anaerolineales bacterium]|nr:aminotransferase class I/II-fold pyridoxal phosphate-dependent enzyme [Anaerolineales bacterium]